MTVDQAIDHLIAREHDEVATIRRFSPLIETYIQDMKTDKEMGAIPVKDHYFLGQADLSKGIVDNSMLGARKGKFDAFNPISHMSGLFTSSYVPEGFLQMIYIDTSGFDRQHYQFDYVRREFLGEVRCVVFDITPLPKSGKGRFKGRVWADDQTFTIVRFNGVYTPIAGINSFNLHFDSWRLNVQPGLWLPAYIYSQESDLRDFFGGDIRFKAQTRLWGYNLKNVGRQEEFSEMTIESPTIQDQAAQSQDRSPIEAQREWQHVAEINVLDRLQRIGLLAPPGEVDKVLETVVNNLEVTNNLDVQPEVHCRVLLTGTLEMFSIGHTIVLEPRIAGRAAGRSQPGDHAGAGIGRHHRDQAFHRSVGIQRHHQRNHHGSAGSFFVQGQPGADSDGQRQGAGTAEEFSLQGQARERRTFPEAAGRAIEEFAGADQSAPRQSRVSERIAVERRSDAGSHEDRSDLRSSGGRAHQARPLERSRRAGEGETDSAALGA